MSYIPDSKTSFEVHYWHLSEQVESFEDAYRARSQFEELYKAAGYYKGYERNVSMMQSLGGDTA